MTPPTTEKKPQQQLRRKNLIVLALLLATIALIYWLSISRISQGIEQAVLKNAARQQQQEISMPVAEMPKTTTEISLENLEADVEEASEDFNRDAEILLENDAVEVEEKDE